MRLVTDRFDPAAWRDQAACVGDMATAFYPPLGPEKRSVKTAREERAKAVCAACPVRPQCLDQAIESGERYGIWGGMTDSERSRLRAS